MDELKKIAGKIKRRKRLSKEDGLALMSCPDILSLGTLAETEKKKRTGDHVFFNINCHINLTNICLSRCSFCAFSCDREDAGAYLMTAHDAVEKVRAALPSGITEVHMVSGLHPDKPFSYYVDVVKTIKDAYPLIHIKAFTPVEVKYFSDISGLSIRDVLLQLQAAGLGSLPGGGAEVLSDRVRAQLCPKKASSFEWLSVMEAAHRLGLRSNATLLYGHIETHQEIIEHLLSLRTLQDETGGFQTFIPLPFHPRNTQIASLVRPTAYEQLKIFAVSRLMLDNFDHIKAYWIMTGLKVAQLALCFGADDIDGTVTEEKITHAAGAETAVGLTKNELLDLIKQAGKVPVQRDTLYALLEKY
ncbi:MAG: aminofutalosine synthase MqnE [Pseudomonadota bacterium]